MDWGYEVINFEIPSIGDFEISRLRNFEIARFGISGFRDIAGSVFRDYMVGISGCRNSMVSRFFEISGIATARFRDAEIL